MSMGGLSNQGDKVREPAATPNLMDPHLAPGAIGDPVALTAADTDLGRGRSWFGMIGRRIVRDRRAQIGLLIIGTIALLCALAPLIGRYDPNSIPTTFALDTANQSPSGTHWFGTDDLGRDLWARMLWGGRVSLPAGLEIVFLSFIVGVPMGMIAGYSRRVVDDAIMRVVDLILTVPGLLLAIAIIGVLGPGYKSLVIALGIAGIPGYARVARASTLRLKSTEYVESSLSAGAGQFHILRRHILPNIIDPLVILGTLSLSGAILAGAALSFLQIGTQLPDADWGTLLFSGFGHMFQSTSELLIPAIALVLSVFAINLVGDALGDALNPRFRGH